MKPPPKTAPAHPDRSIKKSRQTRFNELAQKAASCRLCPRMADQPAVLGPANGNLNTPVVFVAEAPGRFGSGRTGIPFHGDKSGDNFQTLIDHVGLKREGIFITNAVLCNPLSEGCNSKPTASEIKNCTPFLKSLLDLIQPDLVVTLGGVGLDAINRLWATRFRLSECAAKIQRNPNGVLLPLYHPSPRVAHWRRPLARQKKDFKLILKHLQAQP